MKRPLAVVALVSSSLPLVAPARVQSQTEEKPKLQIEIQASTAGSPKFLVTNLSDKTLTACVFEISFSSETKGQTKIDWDALLQKERPLEPGASITENLPRVVGGPLPDKIEIIAGVWADGQTFGQPDWVKVILQNRALRISQYEEAVALLKQGLSEQWSRDRYLEALASKQDSAAVGSIRSTLMANAQLSARSLQRVIQTLLEDATQRLDYMRQKSAP